MIDASFLTNLEEQHHQQQQQQQHHQRPTTSTSAAAAGTNDNDDDDDVSVATTALASEVGSFVGHAHDAFLRSVTFYVSDNTNKNNNNSNNSDANSTTTASTVDWTLTFRDATKRGRRSSTKKMIEIDEIGGVVTLSKLKPGDRLKYINGKKMGPSYNAERATKYLQTCLETTSTTSTNTTTTTQQQQQRQRGYVSVAVGNDEGNDILVQATVIKPKSNMTYEQMGMIVWVWGRLCVKSIAKDSLFKHTVLKSGDHIVSINDIDCEHVSPEGFAHIVSELPSELTIVVKRGKQRWTGKFG
eukprot:CAMPEP_0117012180 /NCGR_PEP_ID=MMETSP0472-20121206/10307_1 /TAXON_ID=693140 ORGANISM="Tiarina fusus, Strain LIS" /NCGR_SAMPLE_ID=MMETSP0472 /ASSEMBLY_ACC=CAM_ASM_000603 /LENGTH=299 /DNA_ID=CAMNT_0004715185 /DNA_START=92 /DNA_END=991 /DNA_ORIENTATION=+